MILGDGFLARGIREAFGEVSFVWVAHHPKVEDSKLRAALLEADAGTLVVFSTPILIGTCAWWEQAFPFLRFAVLPENVREAHPEDWTNQARFVIGARGETPELDFLQPQLRMSPESAEMVKHALNGFLAMSCNYATHVAALARRHKANPDDVALGMMTDPRIGNSAYLKPYGAPGPNLQRELDNLRKLER